MMKLKDYIDLTTCRAIINKSTDDEIKDQFQEKSEVIEEKNFKPDHKKPTLNFETISSQRKMIFPQIHVFTMKIIGKRGSGKTTFLLAFLSSLVQNNLITYDLQSCWNKTSCEIKEIN